MTAFRKVADGGGDRPYRRFIRRDDRMIPTGNIGMVDQCNKGIHNVININKR